ncbi:MAG: adenine phosphoribosyltransferase [Nitrososphaerota archaeon]|jgi:adenine phosphoribosyltransferase|nr:adenine phosphoribosyltransferase [Nitrososphaerota archaeon]MDG6966416.1 adenine phosphoribosyltransferase [Nitrososphaerota archaeon]MDG7020557.1 adenine phosphoribosyltransferase [Nitrososphaerota archaeon]MDG7022082.1 adenine phosphoribosyltransferase [Nitrososphaerota archaeon]
MSGRSGRAEVQAEFKRAIRRIPDFPKKGIVFRDITTLWKDGVLLKRSTDVLYDHYKGKKVDAVMGIEARGFVVGAPLAERLGVGFVPLRKVGKLPGEKVSESYELEYGTATLEIHRDAIRRGERVLIVDDLIATGGTALAAAKLVKVLRGVVAGFGFVVELSFLNGRRTLKGYDVFSVVEYSSEEE